MDATGSVVTKLILPDGSKSPHLFLYQCMIVAKNKRGIPIFQMISTKQDAALLTYFLLEIRRVGAPIPSIVVVDHSRAMLTALARAFSNCSNLKHYLECCYDIVIQKKKAFMPTSYLRLDVSHVIKIISQWECLRHLSKRVRQFYLRSICQAYKMQCLKKLHSLLLSLLVVALSEVIGNAGKDPVPAGTCLQSVNDCIKGDNLEEYDIKSEILADDLDSTEIPSSWQKWSEKIYNTANDLALKSQNGSIVNAFYNPEADKKIKNLTKFATMDGCNASLF